MIIGLFVSAAWGYNFLNPSGAGNQDGGKDRTKGSTMTDAELIRMDGARQGQFIEADANEEFEAWLDSLPVSEPEPFADFIAGHPAFVARLKAIDDRHRASTDKNLADFHRKLDAIFGKPAQIRWNNAAQAFGGVGQHFPGMKYGERGERR